MNNINAVRVFIFIWFNLISYNLNKFLVSCGYNLNKFLDSCGYNKNIYVNTIQKENFCCQNYQY